MYLEGNTSYSRLCDKYNIPNVSAIYQWDHQYTSGKQLTARSVKPVKNGRKTTQLERIEIDQWIIANNMGLLIRYEQVQRIIRSGLFVDSEI